MPVIASTLAASVLAGAFGFGLGAVPAAAADEQSARLLDVCDPTACVVAWGVVDSDGDGVADADELMAGTDPHDAASVPLMATIAELLITRQLPSFEAGYAMAVVLPADLVAMAEKATGDRLAGLMFEGFDIEGRSDTLARLGISTELMAAHGIDTAARTGFTLGLEPATKDDGMPGIRVGGFDLGTISAGGKTEPKKEDPPKKEEPPKDPPKEPAPDGGASDDLAPLSKLPHGGLDPNKDQGLPGKSGGKIFYYMDGTERQVLSNGWNDTKDGKTTYHMNKKFVNPEADAATVAPSLEQVEAWERSLGEVTYTVQGWEAPTTDDEIDPGFDRTLISYIESELVVGIALDFDPDRVTTAQPEVSPRFPDPMQSAPKGGVVGGSGGGCSDSFCGG